MSYYKQTEFREWLKGDPSRWSEDSVKSYVSGINSLIKWFNNNKDTCFLKFEDYLKQIKSQKNRDMFFSSVLTILQTRIYEISKYPDDKEGTLRNYKSYLNAFEEFFRSEPFASNSKERISYNQIKLLRKFSTETIYTKEDLIKEFRQRILTQDRISMSKNVMFPIRLIRKLWSDDTNGWADSVCNKMILIVGKQNSQTKQIEFEEKQIKELQSLKIIKENMSVEVEFENDDDYYQLYTSYSDPYETLRVENGEIKYCKGGNLVGNLKCSIPKNGYVVDKNQNICDINNQTHLWHVKPMIIKTLGDIAIDHDIPISIILNEKEVELESLMKLSNKYKEISAKHSLKVSAKEVNKFCKAIGKGDTEDVKALKDCCGGNFPQNEMGIIGESKLVLMAKDENTMKSDN